MHHTSYKLSPEVYAFWYATGDCRSSVYVYRLDKIPHTVFYGMKGRFFASVQIRLDRVDALV